MNTNYLIKYYRGCHKSKGYTKSLTDKKACMPRF